MGIEYKIRFEVRAREELELRLERILKNIAEVEKEVTVKLEDDGIYFCDNCGDPLISSRIFRRLVDAALSESPEVVIREL